MHHLAKSSAAVDGPTLATLNA